MQLKSLVDELNIILKYAPEAYTRPAPIHTLVWVGSEDLLNKIPEDILGELFSKGWGATYDREIKEQPRNNNVLIRYNI